MKAADLLNNSLPPRTCAPWDFYVTFGSRSERMPYLTPSFLRRDRIDLLAGSAEPESSRRILHGSATASSSSNGRSNGFSRTNLPPLDEINHYFATRCPTPTYGPRAEASPRTLGGRANQRLVGAMYGYISRTC